jgi:hypothetical protein
VVMAKLKIHQHTTQQAYHTVSQKLCHHTQNSKELTTQVQQLTPTVFQLELNFHFKLIKL